MVAAQLMDQLVKTQAERNALRHEVAGIYAPKLSGLNATYLARVKARPSMLYRLA